MIRRVSLSRLVAVFTWTGIVSIGGGRSAFFHDAVVARRRWVGGGEFVQDVTLSQVLPGPNFSNLAIALGYRLAGLAGAAWALAAVLVPGAVVLLALGALYVGRQLTAPTTTLMHGMAAAVVGFVLVTTVRLMRPVLVDRRAAVMTALTFLAVGPLHLNTVVVLVVMAAVGLWLHRPGTRA